MHIDIDKLRDFSEGVTYRGIWNDLFGEGGLTNVYDSEDAQSELVDVLLWDYERGFANYKAYFEPGMDARVLMELRKSAILPFTGELNEFYALHDQCRTADDIKAVRVKYLSPVFVQYEDIPWQYYMVVRYFRGEMRGFVFDFEWCFEDRDMRKQTEVSQYCRDFVAAHSPE